MHRTAARKGLLRPLPPMDLPFLVLVLTLVAFGLVMLCSASSAVALYRRQDAFAYVRPQLLYAAMGLVAMWTASRVDYHIYHKLAWPLLALSLVLLTAVLFMPEYNGCKRWLVLPGLGTLQPSEIAKFAVVLVFAHIISLNHDRMQTFATGVLPFMVILGAVTVLMLLEFGKGVEFGIRYTLPQNSYLVKMDIVQKNMNTIIPANIATMDFHWYQKMARHEMGEMFEERNSGLFYKQLGEGGDVDNLSETSNDREEVEDKLKWIGFKDQFFSSVFIADSYFVGTNHLTSKVIEKDAPDHKDFMKELWAESQMEYSSTNPNPASFHLFFGPNEYKLLASYDDIISPQEDLKLTKMIPLGWSLFRWINTGVIIPIFNFLGSLNLNYGIIILLLTIFIKIVLFPLTYKSYSSQAKMRVLAPDIKEINDKYPGQENALKRNQKMMELYSRAGANPMSGCLPLLLQMPILIAMFSFFPSAIELRGESFLWAKDLSAPDVIFSWDAHIPLISTFFGNHLSLFCLLMTAVNILYTYINMQSNPSGNQMPGMKWMMYLMPVMFLVFFNNYAAGLSYYYFLSLIITIGQTYAFRLIIKEDKVRAKMAENAKKPKKKSGFMARLEEAQRQQQAMLREQQKRKGGK